MRQPKIPSDASGTARSLALLVALTALALSPVLFANFIRLDDQTHLFNNPFLRDGSATGLAHFWTHPYFNLFIPITYSVWWLLAALGGLHNAWLFHGLNLLLHLVNAALVFLWVRALVNRRPRPASPSSAWVPLLAALFFALHPSQVETVAWVSELKGGLSMSFGLLGLLWHLRSKRPVLAGLFFLAAMLAKPSAVVFPGMVFLVDRLVVGKSLRQAALLPILTLAPLLPFVWWTKGLQPDLNLDFIPTLGQRLLVAADAFTFYLRKALFPYPLVVDYGRTPRFVLQQTPGWQIALSALLLLVTLAALAKALLRPRAPSSEPAHTDDGGALVLCGGVIFLLSLTPVLGLVPFGFQQFSTVADHYMYQPLLGGSLVVAGLLLRGQAFVHTPRIAAAVLLLFAGLSFAQARHWRTNEALFTRTLQVNPQSYLGAFCIGDEYLRGGQPEPSLPWLQKSLAINPHYLEAQISLGMAWLQLGQIEKAIEHYNAVLARNPSPVGTRARSVASLHNNLGMLYLQVGRQDEAVERFRSAVRIHPGSLNGHMNLGNFAMAQGRYRDAVVEYEKAQSLSPNTPGIQQRLGLARQRLQEAQPERPANAPTP